MFDNRIIYQDKNILVVNKKPGEICSSSGGKIDETYYLPKLLSDERKYPYIECINRLDRPVSGCTLLSIDEKCTATLIEMFKFHECKKEYWTIIEGVYDEMEEFALLTDYISFNQSIDKAFIAQEPARNSKKAELLYKIEAHGERYSFVRVQLLTGRTHQIRAQLSAHKMHIKGDLKYGAKRSDTIPGIRLHAAKLNFVHPITKKQVNLHCLPNKIDTLWSACIEVLNG